MKLCFRALVDTLLYRFEHKASLLSSICLWHPTFRKMIKTDKKKKWSDTPSHEEDVQLHQSSGNEWTPVGNSPNGLICN